MTGEEPKQSADYPRVWGWMADEGGCGAYRIRFPFDAMLRQGGIILGRGSRIPPQARELADVVVGQRVLNDGPSKLWQGWAAEGKKRLVYEVDDDLANVDPANEQAYYFFNRKDIRQNYIDNIRAAHTVTASTAPLADSIRRLTGHEDVRVIPNAVPPWLIEHEAPQSHLFGWGGSATHAGDFRVVQRALKQFLDNNSDARFHVIGTNYASWLGLPKEQCVFTPWTKSVEDFFRTIDYEFGIAPLAANSFNRAKSDIKFLELAALGRPTIATNVRAYETIEDGITGILVKHEHEWNRKIRGLASDPDKRKYLGENAYEYAKTRTTDETAPLWRKAVLG